MFEPLPKNFCAFFGNQVKMVMILAEIVQKVAINQISAVYENSRCD